MLAEVRQCIATLVRKSANLTDTKRWGQVSRLDADWNQRTTIIASLIPPNTTVLEFGAGCQMLQSLLPETCIYIASDVVPRTETTFVCDLNAPNLPTLPQHETAVFSGVLEYIHDVTRAIDYLRNSTGTVVVSYVPYSERGFSGRLRRLTNGWVNAYSKSEFEQLFEKRGWRRDAEVKWNNQYIWRFAKRNSSPPES
jgi:hypothetical protein